MGKCNSYLCRHRHEQNDAKIERLRSLVDRACNHIEAACGYDSRQEVAEIRAALNQQTTEVLK